MTKTLIFEDIWYNILLNCHVDDLYYFYYINKCTANICNNKKFWFRSG